MNNISILKEKLKSNHENTSGHNLVLLLQRIDKQKKASLAEDR